MAYVCIAALAEERNGPLSRKKKRNRRQQSPSSAPKPLPAKSWGGAAVVLAVGLLVLGAMAYHFWPALHGLFCSDAAPINDPVPLSATAQLDRMLAGPDDKIDLTRAHFLIASEVPVYKGMNIDSEVAQVDRVARYLRLRLEQNRPAFEKEPEKFKNQYGEYCLRMLMTVLHFDKLIPEGMIHVVEGHPDNKDANQLFVNGLFSKKVGTCISLHFVYVLLAERLGWPLYGVTVNDHMFCRWDDGKYRVNIDAVTLGRASPPDSYYAENYGASKEELANSIYLKNLTKRQMIGQFLYARAMHWAGLDQRGKALADAKRALELAGRDPFIEKFVFNLQMVGYPMAGGPARRQEPPLQYNTPPESPDPVKMARGNGPSVPNLQPPIPNPQPRYPVGAGPTAPTHQPAVLLVVVEKKPV